MKESEESRGNFVESREDAAVMLEESEAALDFVAFFVEVPIIVTLKDTVTSGRDNGFGCHAFDISNDGVGVISFVSE